MNPGAIFRIVGGAVLGTFLLGPIAWMVSSSLQLDRDLLKSPAPLLPNNPTLDNYRYIITRTPPESYRHSGTGTRASTEALSILPALKNSTIVAVSVTFVTLVFGTLAAYAFSRVRFRGSGILYTFIISSRLLPGVALAVPTFILIDRMGLLDTHGALILVYMVTALPLTIWFLAKYFSNIPPEIEEAAQIDGCTRLGTLWRIIVPMAAPGIAATAAFAFMSAYSEFVFALFLTRTMAAKTAPVVLVSSAMNFDVSIALSSAAVVLTIAPPIVLALFFQKYISRDAGAQGLTR
jgi:multiple sugar transport system permease protein